jgi:hypothetical protein
LAQRRSTAYFARAAVFSIVALMALGAAAKLHHDFPELLWAWGSLGVLGAFVVCYCAQQYFAGRRCLLRELEGFEKLKELRQVLKVDDPPALLPE